MTTTNDVYLDNAAAAPASAETLDLFKEYASCFHGNQEADHGQGRRVRDAMREAESALAAAVVDDPDARVFWTESGTAALALIVSFSPFAKGHVVTTDVEHPALERALNRRGVEKRIVRLRNDGIIDVDHFADSLSEETRLVAIHHVHSVTGAAQDLSTLRSIMDERAPRAALLADTVQSAGKLPVPWRGGGSDFAVVSGHKFGAPGGGAVIQGGAAPAAFADGVKTARDEDHLISRPNPPVVLTLAETARRLRGIRGAIKRRADALADALTERIEQMAERGNRSISFPVPRNSRSPFINGLLIPGFQGAVLARMLSEEGVHVAAGSACEAARGGPAAALLAMGRSKSDAYSYLRVSFWRENSVDDINRFAAALERILPDY